MASTIVSNANVRAKYPNQAFIDRSVATGNIYSIQQDGSNQLTVYQSTDRGTTWAANTTSRLTITGLQEWTAPFIDNGGFLHFAYRTNESSTDKIYWARCPSPNTAFESAITMASAGNGGVAGSVYSGIDMVVAQPAAGSNTYYIHIAAGTSSGTQNGVTLFSGSAIYGIIGYTFFFPIYGWIKKSNNSLIQGTRQWMNTETVGRVGPNISLHHSGDGHTSSTPHLWVAWGRNAVYLTKVAYNNNSWTGGVGVPVAAPSAAMDYITARFDGSRYLVAVPDGTTTLHIYERDGANTTTVTRDQTNAMASAIVHIGFMFNDLGDLKVWAAGSSGAVQQSNYTRSGNSWGTWSSTSITPSATQNEYGTMRNAYGIARWLWYYRTSTPAVLSDFVAVTYAPNTPMITSPPDGQAQDVAAALVITWSFTDPDPSDVQSGYYLKRQVGAGAAQYWNGSVWGGSEVKNVTATTSATIPSALPWGLNADANHTYSVKVEDSGNLASAYSSVVTVIPSAKVNPTITAPTAAQVLTDNSVTVTWTVSEQTSFRVVLLESGNQVFDSGYVTSPVTTYTPSYTLKDLTSYQAQLTTKNLEGLASTTQTVSFSVDFIEPATPTLQVSPASELGVINVIITNPTPSGGQPALTTQDLYRRVVGDTSDGIRVSTGLLSAATFTDFKVSSGVDYAYRARAFGVNGTNQFSSWQS